MGLTSVISLFIIAFAIEVYLMCPTNVIEREGFGTIQAIQFTHGKTKPSHPLTHNKVIFDFNRYYYIPFSGRSKIVHLPSGTPQKAMKEITQVWLMKSIHHGTPGELDVLGLVFYENGLEEGISPTMIAKIKVNPAEVEGNNALFETSMKHWASFKPVGEDFHFEKMHWENHVTVRAIPEVEFPENYQID